MLGGLDEGASDVAVLDEPVVERDSAFSGITNGGGDRRVRHRDHHVGCGRTLPGQFLAEALAYGVNAGAIPLRVRTGEVNELERTARPASRGGEGLSRGDLVPVECDDLAGSHFPDISTAKGTQRTRFRRHRMAPVGKAPHGQWTKAPRVPDRHHPVGTQQHQRIGAFPCGHGAFQTVLPRSTAGRRQHQCQHLGITGGSESEAAAE